MNHPSNDSSVTPVIPGTHAAVPAKVHSFQTREGFYAEAMADGSVGEEHPGGEYWNRREVWLYPSKEAALAAAAGRPLPLPKPIADSVMIKRNQAGGVSIIPTAVAVFGEIVYG